MKHTVNHLRSLASLHGIPMRDFNTFAPSPNAFLQACNNWFVRNIACEITETMPKALTDWQIATGQRTRAAVSRAKQKKIVITADRQALINHYWIPIRNALRAYIQLERGNASKCAAFIGASQSQIHRWTCPKCEHDQEPSYSLGKAVEIFLITVSQTANQTK